MSEEVIITDHAFEKGKERFSLKVDAFKRLAQKAFNEGLRQSDASGKLGRYMDKIYFEHRTANNLRIYGDNLFIFSHNILITTYQVPSDLKKYVRACKK